MALVTLTVYGRNDDDESKLARMQEVWSEIAIEQIHPEAAAAASVGGVDARPGTLLVRIGLTPLPDGYTVDDTVTRDEWIEYAASLEQGSDIVES